MDLREINAGIKRIGASYGKINALVQAIAVACIVHASEHGDCTPALRLVQAMPKSARRGLLVNWFGRYSPIGMNVTQGKVGFHRETANAYNPFNIEAARLNNWFEGAEANDEQLPDTTRETVRNALFGLAKRFQKKLDNGEVANDDVEAVRASVVAVNELARAA